MARLILRIAAAHWAAQPGCRVPTVHSLLVVAGEQPVTASCWLGKLLCSLRCRHLQRFPDSPARERLLTFLIQWIGRE